MITEVRIKLMDEGNNDNERLQAFCSVTFDDAYVVRDLKIIEGTKGSFVAMPSRKLTDRCQSCGSKNHLRALAAQAPRRHRPPDQRHLPPADRAGRAAGVLARGRAEQAAGLRPAQS